MKTTSFLSSLIVVPSIAFVWYAVTQYPQHRVLTWHEILTDGHAPDVLAENGRLVLGRIWTRAFQEGHIADSGVAQALKGHIQRLSPNSREVDIMEMAAGSGVAAALWNEELSQHGLSVRSVLTDLQPTVPAWKKLIQDVSTISSNNNQSSSLSYVDVPVDATDASVTISKFYKDWGQQEAKKSSETTTTTDDDDNNNNRNAVEIRMIHFALHHMTPPLVKEIFCDATKSNSLIVVGDLEPNVENLLLNGIGGFMELQMEIKTIVQRRPLDILLLPFMPILFFVALHDATVSVLRSYSIGELDNILQECTSTYQVEKFEVYPFGDYFYIGCSLMPWLCRKRHIQFFVASPATP